MGQQGVDGFDQFLDKGLHLADGVADRPLQPFHGTVFQHRLTGQRRQHLQLQGELGFQRSAHHQEHHRGDAKAHQQAGQHETSAQGRGAQQGIDQKGEERAGRQAGQVGQIKHFFQVRDFAAAQINHHRLLCEGMKFIENSTCWQLT